MTSTPTSTGVGGLLAGLTMIAGRGYVARLAADLTELTYEDRLVDVGCGPGSAARGAARRGAVVTGIDPAPVMLSLARRLTPPSLSITWTEGAAEALPVPDESATVLWSLSTVHHWRAVDVGLTEAHRVLAPNGRLLVTERLTRPGATGLASHGWTNEQAQVFVDLCHATGFTHARAQNYHRGQHALLVVLATRP